MQRGSEEKEGGNGYSATLQIPWTCPLEPRGQSQHGVSVTTNKTRYKGMLYFP